MTRQQQLAVDAYHARNYFSAGLGTDVSVIGRAAGSGILSAAGIVAAIPGGQLPGAVLAAAGALTSLITGFFKPDLTKIEATHIVDQIEAQVMKPLIASWRALPAEKKTASMQAAYLKVFNDGWQSVMQGCSNPQLGQAGVNCISDRVRGGRWPWAEYYQDPILNDPDVHPDPVSESGAEISSAVSNLFGGEGIPAPLLIGAAVLLLWAVMD